MSQFSDQIRKEWAVNDAKRDEGLTTPENVVRYDDISYGPLKKWNDLDVYRPKDADGKLPVIVVVHGGGWVYGDKELYQFYAMSLAGRGFSVINYSYRLAPEYKFPAPLEDTNAVISWMFDHQDAYGLDMEHVFLAGDSAGAHLAALYAAICTDPQFAMQFAFTVPEGFVPTALALNCGLYHPLGGKTEAEQLGVELMKDFLPGVDAKTEAWMVDATAHVGDAFPPSFVMSARGDYCLPQFPGMVAALCEHQIPITCKVYGNDDNPLFHVFHVTIQEPLGQQCNDEECAYFRSFC